MTEPNPYQATTAGIFEPRDLDAPIAGKWRRFATCLIDIVCFYALFTVILIVLVLMGADAVINAMDGATGVLMSFIVYFIYFVSLEAMFSRTIGKLVAGTKVMGVDGSRPTLWQVFLRTLCRHIPFEPFSLLASDEGIAWHDSIPKTKVVCTRRPA